MTVNKMAMLTVRNLPDDVHRALRAQAVQHGHITEAEVRGDTENGSQARISGSYRRSFSGIGS